MFFVFWYFSLREKKRKRWLNFLPVGADSKSGATWVGTGQAIPAVAHHFARSLSRSLARSNKLRILFWFSVAVGASLQHSRRETQTSCCCCCFSSRKEGRKEERKKTTCRITTAAAADRRGSFSKAKETTISLFSLATRGS